MSTSARATEPRPTPVATGVTVTEDVLGVDLSDGRTIAVPLLWYSRLVHGTPQERAHWQLIGGGKGIHWPDLDEDISCGGPAGGAAVGRKSALPQALVRVTRHSRLTFVAADGRWKHRGFRLVGARPMSGIFVDR